MKEIRNIIFDFGGVIINIDTSNVGRALLRKGADNIDDIHRYLLENKAYTDLETGKITPAQFRDAIRSRLKTELSDDEIDEAWNSIILDIPESRVRLLEEISDDYDIYLLSNTNTIHYNFYNRHFSETFGYDGLSSLFKEAYFSHELGMRKPDPDIFRFVLRKSKLVPAETFFIDDHIDNVKAANELGIKGFQLKSNMDLTDLFREGKLAV